MKIPLLILGLTTIAALASLPLQAAVTAFDTDPDIAGSWENNTYLISTGTATWNAGDQDLDLAAGTGTTSWAVLSETVATRAADESVTLDIKSVSANNTSPSFTDFALVGITLSSTGSPALQDGTPHYTFSLRGTLYVGGGQDWFYQILDGKNPVNEIYASANFPVPTTTTTLAIERNGDEYDFLANGSVIYTSAGSYTAAQNDSMVNYHIAYASGTFTTFNATVDNFGVVVAVPEPSSTALLGLGGLALALRRRR